MTKTGRADDTLRIGALASRTGVSVEALRYYEKRGLLRPAARRSTGYRAYTADSVRLVRFIKRAQALGFSLAEVEDLVRLRERAWSGDAPVQLRGAAVSKLEDIDRRIGQLGALRGALAELVSACDTACRVEGPPSARECQPATSLPCSLIEALDPDEDESERERLPELTLAGPPVTLDMTNPPASRRRAGVRRQPSTRQASLNQRRIP